MPPKRKNATSVAASAPAPLKQSKKQSQTDFEVRWEWEDSLDGWIAYEQKHNDEIKSVLELNKKEVCLTLANGDSVTIKLDKMVQYEKADSKTEKKIRCSLKDGNNPWFTWRVEDGCGDWIPYNAVVSKTLETALHKGDTETEFKIGRSMFTVDVKSMMQSNRKGTETRKVERLQIANASSGTAASAVNPTNNSAIQNNGNQNNTSAPAKKRSKKNSTKEPDDDIVSQETKIVTMKGGAPVDSYCVAKVGKAYVYCEGNDVWDAMLNQTNVQFNNNKFYILQLLKDDGTANSYSVWFRWGRVGNKGQSSLTDFGSDLERAKNTFTKKFFDKTKNVWNARDSFTKVTGYYDLLHMDYNPTAEDSTDAPDKTVKLNIPESKLDKRLQDLINLVCSVQTMEEAVLEMKYDSKKAPLGKLTSEQIKAGYLALKEIETLVADGKTGKELLQACNDFYTRIPHNFGMKTPPIIRTRAEILQKMQLLEILGDIQIVMKMMKETGNDLENPVDSHYKGLDCNIIPLEQDSKMYKVIEQYLKNSHEKTHNMYKMKILDIFECNKSEEERQFIKYDNRMLLWHGSRLANWAGILKQGLRIAPPEAPCTGYMFGKGVYFADRCSKSANYCHTSRTNNIGFLLLCEVSLGECNELISADYQADKLPVGKNSVKGIGTMVPNPKQTITLEDGLVVPIGKSYSKENGEYLCLNFNEFVVYDTKQIKMRYLVKVKFDFNV